MQRADKLLFEKGLAKSRSAAQSLIADGKVLASGRRVYKPSELLPEDCELTVTGSEFYVSRGGLKLAHALDHFGIDVSGDVCADIGASTGGFTDCLLQNGAAKVYCVDSGHGQLDQKILNDARVVNIEGFNARTLDEGVLGERCDTAVMDVSFISQTLLHKNVYTILKDGGKFISLIKPQFEAGRENIGKHGIADPACRDDVINKVVASAAACGFEHIGTTGSPIKGGDGNVEFIAYFIKREKS